MGLKKMDKNKKLALLNGAELKWFNCKTKLIMINDKLYRRGKEILGIIIVGQYQMIVWDVDHAYIMKWKDNKVTEIQAGTSEKLKIELYLAYLNEHWSLLDDSRYTEGNRLQHLLGLSISLNRYKDMQNYLKLRVHKDGILIYSDMWGWYMRKDNKIIFVHNITNNSCYMTDWMVLLDKNGEPLEDFLLLDEKGYIYDKQGNKVRKIPKEQTIARNRNNGMCLTVEEVNQKIIVRKIDGTELCRFDNKEPRELMAHISVIQDSTLSNFYTYSIDTDKYSHKSKIRLHTYSSDFCFKVENKIIGI